MSFVKEREKLMGKMSRKLEEVNLRVGGGVGGGTGRGGGCTGRHRGVAMRILGHHVP